MFGRVSGFNSLDGAVVVDEGQDVVEGVVGALQLHPAAAAALVPGGVGGGGWGLQDEVVLDGRVGRQLGVGVRGR